MWEFREASPMVMLNNLGFPLLLTIMLFLPAAGGVLVLLLPGGNDADSSDHWGLAKWVAILTALSTFGLSLFFLVKFRGNPQSGRLTASTLLPHQFHAPVIQFAEHATWLPRLGVSYFLGIDGISIWLVLLCTAVMTLAIIASCFMINRRVKAFLMLMLVAETGMLGVFLSWNLFLFYVFWEAMLIPAYLLIGMWGEKRRVYATTKFVIYTIFGSFLMLVGIFYLWVTVPAHNLDVPYLMAHPLANGPQAWVFLAFMLALGIKSGLFPFHSWAPDAYVEAPIPATVLIASVMAKTAVFSMLRFVLPIVPHAVNQFSGLIEILALVGILYGATMALVQNDVKRVLAYASISHMNIIILGIFALDQQGIDGSILQMVNHGVIMTGLFFVVAMMYARSGTRRLDEMSGLAKTFPVLAGFALLLFLAAMDLPGLGSFAGEFTILIGVFLTNAWYATIAALVTVVSAWYMVRWFQGILHGQVGTQVHAANVEGDSDSEPATAYEFPVRVPRITSDLRKLEWFLLIPVAAVVIWLGVIPKPFTDRTAPTVAQLTKMVHVARHSAGLTAASAAPETFHVLGVPNITGGLNNVVSIEKPPNINFLWIHFAVAVHGSKVGMIPGGLSRATRGANR